MSLDLADKKDFLRAVGIVIALLQQRYGVSSPKLAQLLGVHENTISNWRMGRVDPGSHNLYRIGKVFGVNLIQVLEEVYGEPDAVPSVVAETSGRCHPPSYRGLT